MKRVRVIAEARNTAGGGAEKREEKLKTWSHPASLLPVFMLLAQNSG